MKKTSYIIIFLTVMPFVLVLLSPLLIKPFLIDRHSDRDEHQIIASDYFDAIATAQFSDIKINTNHIILSTADGGNSTTIIRAGEQCRVLVPDNLRKYVTCEVENGCLSINLAADAEHKLINHCVNLFIIETPTFKSLEHDGNTIVFIEDFKQDECSISQTKDLLLYNCHLGQLNLNSENSVLTLDNSSVKCLNSLGRTRNLTTNSSRIDTLNINSPGRYFKFDASKCNIGFMTVNPGEESSSIDLSFNKPISIDYGHND